MRPEDLPDDVRSEFERRVERAVLVLWAILHLEIASAAVAAFRSRRRVGHAAFAPWLGLTLAVSRSAIDLGGFVTHRALAPPDAPA